jgi:hypothetical protein
LPVEVFLSTVDWEGFIHYFIGSLFRIRKAVRFVGGVVSWLALLGSGNGEGIYTEEKAKQRERERERWRLRFFGEEIESNFGSHDWKFAKPSSKKTMLVKNVID